MTEQHIARSYHERLLKIFGDDLTFSLAWTGTADISSSAGFGQPRHLAVVSSKIDLIPLREEVVSATTGPTNPPHLTVLSKKSAKRFFWLFPQQMQRLLSKSAIFGTVPADMKRVTSAAEDEAWMAEQLLHLSAEVMAQPPQLVRLLDLLPAELSNQPLSPIDGYISLLTQSKFIADNVPLPSDPPPVPFSEAVAIYRKLDTIIFATNDPIHTITQLDFKAIDRWLTENSGKRLQLCTPKQLQTIVAERDLLSLRLSTYQHLWGVKLLDDLVFHDSKIIEGAAQNATFWETEAIGRRLYLPDPAEELGLPLVHDLQNRLLNIRLKNEILSRLGIITATQMTFELPERSQSLEKRLKVIAYLFDYWSGFYFSQIDYS